MEVEATPIFFLKKYENILLSSVKAVELPVFAWWLVEGALNLFWAMDNMGIFPWVNRNQLNDLNCILREVDLLEDVKGKGAWSKHLGYPFLPQSSL